MPQTQTMTEQQLAARIRQRYPGQYQGVSDTDLTKAWVTKYPTYKSMLVPQGSSRVILPPAEDQVVSEAPFSARYLQSFGAPITQEEEDQSRRGELKKEAAVAGASLVFPPAGGLKALWDMLSAAGSQAKKGFGESVGIGHDVSSDVSNAKTPQELRDALLRGMTRTGVSAAETITKMVPGGESVWNYGEDIRNKNYRGAAGFGTAAVLQALLADSMERVPRSQTPLATRARVAQLVRATQGAGGVEGANEIGPAIELTHDDIVQAAKEDIFTQGKMPQTQTDWQRIANSAERKLNTRFGARVQQLGNNQYMPSKVADALETEAARLDEQGETTAAQAYRAQATKFRQPRTARWLDGQREIANRRANYYKMGGQNVASATAGEEGAMWQTIADTTRDVLYDDILDKAFPGEGFRDMKLRQQALGRIKDTLGTKGKPGTISRTQTSQLAEEGTPFPKRVGATGTLHRSGVFPRAHAPLEKLFPGTFGPERQAGRAVKKAFRGLKGQPPSIPPSNPPVVPVGGSASPGGGSTPPTPPGPSGGPPSTSGGPVSRTISPGSQFPEAFPISSRLKSVFEGLESLGMPEEAGPVRPRPTTEPTTATESRPYPHAKLSPRGEDIMLRKPPDVPEIVWVRLTPEGKAQWIRWTQQASQTVGTKAGAELDTMAFAQATKELGPGANVHAVIDRANQIKEEMLRKGGARP